MPACQVRLELDEPSATFQAGSKITGRVLVSVFGEVKFRKVAVRLRWETHGKGNKDDETVSEVRLLEAGTWTEGQELTLPFELQTPSGPVTYHGHYVNLDWFVEAIVDIPWAPDAEDSVPVALLGGPPDPAGYRAGPPYAYFPPEPPDVSPPSSIHSIPFFVGWLFIGLTVLFLAIGLNVRDDGGQVLLILGGAFGFIGLLLLVASFTNVFSERGIGKPLVHIEPLEVPGGGLVQVRVTLNPKKELELLGATVCLRAQEEAVQGSGTQKKTYLERIYDRTHSPVDCPKFLEPGRPVEISWEIPIPAMAPPTLGAYYNKVTWAVVVQLDLAGWPDWRKEFPVVVLPTQGVVHTLYAFRAHMAQPAPQP